MTARYMPKTSGTGATVNYVEGAALQANGVETGFNLVKIDVMAQTYQVRQFRLGQGHVRPGCSECIDVYSQPSAPGAPIRQQ